MEFLWFGDRGRPVLFFPTSMGTFYQNEDFGLTGALADKVDAGWLQLVCVDSVDAESWYDKTIPPAARARRHDAYDRYLRDEMLPYITSRAGGNIVTVGASFGAYHAANVAARYPGVVTKAICFSGLYDVYQFLHGYWDETCYYHTPTASIANMDAEWCAETWDIPAASTAMAASAHGRSPATMTQRTSEGRAGAVSTGRRSPRFWLSSMASSRSTALR